MGIAVVDIRKNKKIKPLLKIYRVAYGQDNASKEDREYRATRDGPVGTLKEWKAQYGHKYNFEIIEKDSKNYLREMGYKRW